MTSRLPLGPDDLAVEIIAFLRVQIREDVQTARATLWDGSGNVLNWTEAASATLDVGTETINLDDRTIKEHVQRHDPARVVREAEAKLRHVDLCEYQAGWQAGGSSDVTDHEIRMMRTGAAEHLRLLAAPYADRPGYKETWKL
jgi:hypothetical protein